MMMRRVSDISQQLDHILGGLPALLPELVLTIAFILSIGSGLFADRRWKHSTFAVTIAGIALAAYYGILQLGAAPAPDLLFGMLDADAFGRHTSILVGVVCLLFVLFVNAHQGFRNHTKKSADLYTVLLAVHIGLNLMSMATHWLLVFVSIEMVSIGSYIMVGYLSGEARQTEAAMKYVLFGSVCSAVMLYGMSFLYGFSGSLDFTSPSHVTGLQDAAPLPAAVALLFVFTGIGFKLSFVPFHFWTPDVYQGAPTPVTAFLSTAPKIAGIALLARILYAWPAESMAYQYLHSFLLISAIATMLLGNLAALRQTHVKRMMAYSSIGHTGFLMMAVLAYSAGEYGVILFYLSVYSLMNMGVFLFADYIESRTGATDVDEYHGLGPAMPVAFVSFVLLLISLTGIPPTSGFVAKLLVFTAVFGKWQLTGNPGMIALLIVGALTTVISLFYYFKIPLNAFLRKSETTAETKPLQTYVAALAVLITLAVLILGVFPGWLMR